MAQNTPKSEPLTSAPGAAELAAPSPSPLMPRARRYDGWTEEKQVGFLRMLAATQSVAAAARSVGMGRQSAYKLRARLDEQPFGAAWRLAMRGARDVLVEAAIDRAVNGVEVPHYWQGELVGTSRRYDERLTALLLTSGALDRQPMMKAPAEEMFAELEFSTMLARIEHGPAEWCDFELQPDLDLADYAAECAVEKDEECADDAKVSPSEDGSNISTNISGV